MIARLRSLFTNSAKQKLEKKLEIFLGQIRPSILLISLPASRQRRSESSSGAETDFIHYVDIDSYYFKNEVNLTSTKNIQDKKRCEKLKDYILNDKKFHKAILRLESLGATWQFVVDGCYDKSILTFQMHVPENVLPELELLAASDMGIIEPAAQAEAQEKFRIFMLRNYANDWEHNREKYPDVGGSLYLPQETWMSDT